MSRPRTVALLFVACLAGAFIVSDVVANRWPTLLTVPWTTAAALAFAGAVLLVAAWPVRQYVRGARPWVDPLRAAAILACAKACVWAGSALAGTWGAVVIRSIMEWSSPAFHERALLAGGATLASMVLAASGLLAEHWCRLPPPDEETPAAA